MNVNLNNDNSDYVRGYKDGKKAAIKNDQPASASTQERIKANAWSNAESKCGEEVTPYRSGYFYGYIAGATAENSRAQKRTQELIDVFKKIVHAPVPANEREYMAWFVAVKNIAGGVISEWEADNEIEQWKGKEVEP